MNSLETVLRDVRTAYSPDAAARARVREGIGAALAASGAAQLAGGATAKGATLGKASAVAHGLSRGLSWGVGVGLAGALAVGWVTLRPSASVTPAVSRIRAVDVHSLQAPAAIDLSLDDETRAVLLVHDDAEAEARVAANPRKSRATAAASEAEAGTTESDKHSTLLEELALIRGASQALRAGEPARARALLAEHRERFPKSVLATERRGLSLLTTCSEGTSASTRAAAKQFLKAAPNSPLAVHVKKECLD